MSNIIEEMKSRLIFDENKVPLYTVPSALITHDKKNVTTAFDWVNFQRKYIVDLFEEYMYGTIPGRPDSVVFKLLSLKDNALDGLAIRKEVRIHFMMSNGKSHKMDLLLHLPKKDKLPVPVFLGLNFKGNASVTYDKDIPLSENKHVSDPNPPSDRYYMPPVDESTRGDQYGSWQLKRVIERGYASATVYYGDIFPDSSYGFKDSIFALFHDDKELDEKDKTFGAIVAWAWGLSRAMDYIESDPSLDSRQVIVHGHSRLGKAALWAAANDMRFASVISNDSGCAGAAFKRRCFGESIEWLSYWRPYWFHHNYQKFSRKEDKLPVDQHMLISLLAPRPVYVASAEDDPNADPKGEFLSLVYASPVYKLFGSNGINTDIMPDVNTPVHADLGYHIRSGPHGLTGVDWKYFLDFTDKYFR